MPARHTSMTPPSMQRQRGAALMIFLVILVVGALTLFVNSLVNSTNGIQIARNKTTAEALAQAKAALIGRATSDANNPGSLPCPDTNDDGSAESPLYGSSHDCPSYIGRLPWRTLGLPQLRDGTGEELWYALSPNFRDYISSNPINSDTAGTLTITDASNSTTTASNVIAVVFAPGSILTGQDRSSTLTASNYLDGTNGTASPYSSPNSAYQTDTSSSSFNDQLIYITHDQLFAPVEMRIAREAKKCLDDYATSSASKYPWPASITDNTYTGTYSTLFGRFSTTPNIDTTSGGGGAAADTLSSALTALKTALDAYNASSTTANKTTLQNAANTVISLKSSVAGVSSTTIDQAGDYGLFFASGSTSYTTATSYYTAAVSALAPYLSSTDGTMSPSWPTSCTLFSSSYWSSWRDEVFYQVAGTTSGPYGYIPGGDASCTNTTCLSITGSGNTSAGSGSYHAAVIVAGQALTTPTTTQTRSSATHIYAFPPDDYLANSTSEIDPVVPVTHPTSIVNSHTSETSPASTFVTYKVTDTTHQTVNDLVLCVDGYNASTNPTANCK